MAFLQNAQLPGVDMSALAGVSPDQLAAIVRLLQSGALAMAPAVDGLPSQGAAAATATAQQQTEPTQETDADMDKEEGEIEEGGTPTQPRDFLRPPPTGPRNLSASPRESQGQTQRGATSSRETAGSHKLTERPLSKQNQRGAINGSAGRKAACSKSEASRRFILEMVKSGYTYEQLEKEVGNAQALHRMFKQLGLPIRSETKSSTISGLNGATSLPTQQQARETRKESGTKQPLPSKPAAVDRSVYLARLQAAKNKKTETAKPQPDTSKSAEMPSTPASDVPNKAQAQVQRPISSGKPSQTTNIVKTDLVRQRLEALKAQQAASKSAAPPSIDALVPSSPALQPSASSPNGQVISSPQNILGSGISGISQKAAHHGAPPNMPNKQSSPLQKQSQDRAPAPSVTSPTPSTPGRSFSNLPGLFMAQQPAVAPSQASSQTHPASDIPKVDQSFQSKPVTANPQKFIDTPSASPAPLTVPRKRPVASDFDPPSIEAASKRPFGQSRGNSEDESFIIEASDDEYEDDEEVDMEVDEQPSSSAQSAYKTKPFRDVPALRNFPPRSKVLQQGSAPSTPSAGGNTPGGGGVTLEQMNRDIEAYKRKIAEREKVAKANGTHSSAVKGAETVDVTTSAVGMLGSTSTPLNQNAAQHRSGSGDALKSTASMSQRDEKERLKQRLIELERNELQHDAEAVEAAADAKPGIAVSEELDDASEPMHVENEESQVEEQNVVREDRELSDDSMDNLYETQGPQDPTAVSRETKIGSAVAGEPANINLQSMAVSNMNEAETAPAQIEAPDDVGAPVPDIAAAHEQQPNDILDPESMEEDVEAEGGSESDLDGLDSYARTDVEKEDVEMENEADEGEIESLSASSTGLEDQTLESRDPLYSMEPEQGNFKASASPAADNDLATEIQPSQEKLLGALNEVSATSDRPGEND